jgi:hypothetical protein
MASWGTCYSASNNIHFNFPPIMNDGRNFASWQPEAVINNRIQAQENIHTNWNYRQFMQNNGIEIMKYNALESCYDLGLNPHSETGTTPSTNVPFMYKNAFDTGAPGYGYSNSDLKRPYLSSYQLNARLISPSINPANFK